MHKCIIHGQYKGSKCEQCKTSYDKIFEEHSHFSLFLLKGTILMFAGIGLGWYLFTL